MNQSIRGYWERSRSPRYSLLLVLPLVGAYELLAASLATGAGGVRNGADAILRSLFSTFLGPYGPLAFGLLIFLVCVWLFRRDMRASGGDLKASVLLLMAFEAVVLASLFGIVVGTVTAHLLNPFHGLAMGLQAGLSAPQRLMVSLGAGVYEELLFRVILVSALTYTCREIFGWSTVRSAIGAVLVSATIFSLFHYIGPHGDTFAVPSFLFRFVAGVFFSALYVLRGFGITAWTHALYDVYLLF